MRVKRRVKAHADTAGGVSRGRVRRARRFCGNKCSEKRMGDECFYHRGDQWASP